MHKGPFREIGKQMIDDGVIKFNYQLSKKVLTAFENDYNSLEFWRQKLFTLNLIGEYLPEKIGFGNLSKRIDNQTFLISGTQTGALAHLKLEHYALVTNYDLTTMRVEAEGEIAPSSESLTHGAIYLFNPQINYIFHGHHKKIWHYLCEHHPEFTPATISYGTTEMAYSARDCINEKTSGLFVMKGHEDGFIAYGKTATECWESLPLHLLP